MSNNKSLWAVMMTVALMSAMLVACGKEPTTPTPVPATATLVPTPTPAATPTPSASDHMDVGLAYYEQGQLDEAIAEFKEAIQLDPEYADAHFNLGLAYYKQGKLDEAVAAYREAIRSDPDHAEAHNNLGLAYDAQGKPDEAIAEYKEAIRSDPDDDTAHYNLALAYYDQGQLDEAIAEYKEAIRINPDNVDAHYNLGRAYYEQGKLDEAMVEWKETIRIQPDDSMAHNNLGRATYDQGRLGEAETELKEAIRLDPENALPHFNLGLVYRKQGQVNEAVAAFEAYLQLIPPDAPNRETVEQEIAKLKGSGVEYRNTTTGYSLLYPENLYHDEEDTWAVFSESEAAVETAFDYAIGDAIKEAPVAMFDALPLAELAEDYGLEETADPAQFLGAMAEDLEAEIDEIETGTLQGYPAALAQTSGTLEGTSYTGALAIILVEDRAIGATAMASPDQWDAFRPTFVDMLNSLLFFEPQE